MDSRRIFSISKFWIVALSSNYFKSSFMGVLCDRISQEIKLFNQDFLDGRYGTYSKDFDYPKMEVLA